jgi:hypothetical protein
MTSKEASPWERRALRADVAASYVRSQLALGLSLARSIDAPLESARYTSFLPIGASEAAAHSFTDGLGLSPSRAGDGSTQPVTRPTVHVVSFLGEEIQRSGSSLVVEDHIAHGGIPSGPSDRGSPCRFTCGEEVYYVVTPPSATSQAVDTALRRGTSYMAVAVLTEAGLDLQCDSDVSPPAIAQLGGAASVVVVGAYDREGYLIVEL